MSNSRGLVFHMRLINVFPIVITASLCACIGSRIFASELKKCPDIKDSHYASKDNFYLDTSIHSYWLLPIKGVSNIDIKKTIDNLKSNGFTLKHKPRLVCTYVREVNRYTTRECLNTINNNVFDPLWSTDSILLPDKDGQVVEFGISEAGPSVWHYSVSCRDNRLSSYDLYYLYNYLSSGGGEQRYRQKIPFLLLERRQSPINVIHGKPSPNL